MTELSAKVTGLAEQIRGDTFKSDNRWVKTPSRGELTHWRPRPSTFAEDWWGFYLAWIL